MKEADEAIEVRFYGVHWSYYLSCYSVSNFALYVTSIFPNPILYPCLILSNFDSYLLLTTLLILTTFVIAMILYNLD